MQESGYVLLTHRLPFKIAAIFFALVLWLVVSAEEPTQDLVPVRFQPVVDSGMTLVSAPQEVRALVVGRAREVLQLYSRPPVISRIVHADVGDTVVIELRPEDVDLPPDAGAIVRDVQPRRVMLRFASTMQRELPVQSLLDITADTGFRISGPPVFEPESVLVTGDRRVVPTLAGVPTVAAHLAVRDSVAIRVALDTARLGVRARPSSVLVRIPVVPDTGTVAAPDTAAPSQSNE